MHGAAGNASCPQLPEAWVTWASWTNWAGLGTHWQGPSQGDSDEWPSQSVGPKCLLKSGPHGALPKIPHRTGFVLNLHSSWTSRVWPSLILHLPCPFTLSPAHLPYFPAFGTFGQWMNPSLNMVPYSVYGIQLTGSFPLHGTFTPEHSDLSYVGSHKPAPVGALGILPCCPDCP